MGVWAPKTEDVVAKYTAPPSKFMDINGIKVHLRDEGTGRWIEEWVWIEAHWEENGHWEDTDGDGAADKSTVFHQGRDVDSALGICVVGDGPGFVGGLLDNCVLVPLTAGWLHSEYGHWAAALIHPLYLLAGSVLLAWVVGKAGHALYHRMAGDDHYAFLVLVGLVPVFSSSGVVLNFTMTALYACLIAQAWNILGGFGGQFSFGHALFFGTGAYAHAIAQMQLGLNPWLSLPLAMGVAVAVGAGVGALSGASRNSDNWHRYYEDRYYDCMKQP